MVGHGGSSAGSYLADPTSCIPSHCASIVGTSTLRVNTEKNLIAAASGSPRAEWALDSVVIAVNDSSMPGFEEDFGPRSQDNVWYMAMNAAVPRVTCHSASDALEFSKNGGEKRGE